MAPMRVLLLLLTASMAFAQTEYDLLLKGGRVIDPKNKISAVRDVAIAGGKIAAVEANIPAARARRTVDVSGLYVTPGIIDIHTHVYTGTGERNSYAGDNSVYPDGFTLRVGVTTVADAGGAGWRNFEDFKNRVIDRSQTRVLAFLNIVGNGMRGGKFEQDLGDMEVKPTVEMAQKYKGLIVGIKSAHFTGPEWAPFERGEEAARIAGIPLMVDFGSNRPERPLNDLLNKVYRPGDIYTHMYSGLRGEQDPATGGPSKALIDARKRGVIFDVGHGGGSFLWRLAVPMMKAGFVPDTISTDLHIGSMNSGHERPVERHEQVPGDGDAARRSDSPLHLESGPRDPARGIGPSHGGSDRRRGRAAPREGQLRLRRLERRPAPRVAEAAVRADRSRTAGRSMI